MARVRFLVGCLCSWYTATLLLLVLPAIAAPSTKPLGAKFSAMVRHDADAWRVVSRATIVDTKSAELRAALTEIFSRLPDAIEVRTFEAAVRQQTAAVFRNVNLAVHDLNEPGTWNWVISATAPPAGFSHIVIWVETQALPPTLTPDSCVARYERPLTLAELRDSDGITIPAFAEANPARDALVEAATIRLIGTNPAAQCPGRDSTALHTILTIAARAATAAADEYTRSQYPQVYREKIDGAVQQAVSAEGLAPEYVVKTSFQPSDNTDATALVVKLVGLDPATRAEVRMAAIDLPTKDGTALAFARFLDRYKNTGFAEKMAQDAETYRQTVTAHLQQIWPDAAFPRFITTEQRGAAATRLQKDLPNVSQVAFATASSDGNSPSNGAIILNCTYHPSVAKYTAAVEGDSVRTASARFTYSYQKPWIAGDSLDASAAGGTDGYSAGTSYQFPFTQERSIVGPYEGHVRAAANYELLRNVRLGTRHGPLITLREIRVGPQVSLKKAWTFPSGTGGGAPAFNVLTVEPSLSLEERSLRGRGPAPEIGEPAALHGPIVTAKLVAAYDFGSWNLGAALEANRWYPHDGTAYSLGRGTAFVRRALGSADETVGFLEARGELATLGAGAPRIDFLRLGGDQWLRGLDLGELAGRSTATVTFEGGPTLGQVLHWIPRHRGQAHPEAAAQPPTEEERQAAANAARLLQSTYVYAFFEHGHVSRQEHAGQDFNGTHTAIAYGLGARLMGGVAGLPPGASVELGYGWSPQGIRRSGRFFVTALFLFPP